MKNDEVCWSMTQSFIHWLNSNWNGKNFAWNINKFRNIISEIELKDLKDPLWIETVKLTEKDEAEVII